MTSWIRANPLPKGQSLLERPMLFETTDEGLCANFNQFLYAYVYAAIQGKALTVFDMQNCVSPSFPLIKSTFADVTGVNYVDSMVPSAISLKRAQPKVMETVKGLPLETLCKTAQDIFKWGPQMTPILKDIFDKAGLPTAFDLGIHIRAGDKITTRQMNAISIDKYVAATKKYQTESGLDELHIFIMTDTVSLRSQFIQKADASWKVHYLPTPLPQPDGHVQSAFNNSPRRVKTAAYNYFIAELVVMQSIPDILCTLSSNVGRFLYYTVEHPEGIMSLDAKMIVS
jgi:hypothetical protein